MYLPEKPIITANKNIFLNLSLTSCSTFSRDVRLKGAVRVSRIAEFGRTSAGSSLQISPLFRILPLVDEWWLLVLVATEMLASLFYEKQPFGLARKRGFCPRMARGKPDMPKMTRNGLNVV